MENKKKLIYVASALLALIGAYPLYRFARQKMSPRQPAAREAELARATPGAGTFSAPSSINSGEYLFDGAADGGLTAAGSALTAPDPAAASSDGSGASVSEPASDTPGDAGNSAAAPAPERLEGGAARISEVPAQNFSRSASVSANTGGAAGAGGRQGDFGSAGRKTASSPGYRSGSAPRGAVAGLPAEAFTGDMTQAQTDELVSRFKKGNLTPFQIDALIKLVNSGMKFTERQAEIFRNIRAKDEKKIDEEMAKASRTPVELPPDLPLQRGKFWPVGGKITQKFGPTNWNVYAGRTYNGVYYPHFHNGLDIAAPLGSPLRAFDAGRVTAVGGTQSTGVYVVVAHPGGLATTYFHMPVGGPTVSVGQYVGAGQVVGSVGLTGMTTGPHVHFIARRGDVIDPMSVLP